MLVVGTKARRTRQEGLGIVQVVQAPHLGPTSRVTLGDVLSPFRPGQESWAPVDLILGCYRHAQGRGGAQSTTSVNVSVTSRSLSLSPVDLRMQWMDLLFGTLSTGPTLLF